MSKKLIVDLKGKTCIVTGAGGAIGKSFAEEFARCGANVVLVGRTYSKLEDTMKSIQEAGGECTIITCDVGDPKSIDELVAKTLEKYGTIDVLANNAGINGGSEDRVNFWEYNDDLFEKVIRTDLGSIYYCSKAVAKQMIKQGSGSIINTASVTGIAPLRLQCAYCAAKAAVINLTKAMAIEIAPYGIRVNAICPGQVLNDNLKDVFYGDKAKATAQLSHVPMNRTGEAYEQASLACFLASDDSSYMTGTVNVADGG